MDEITPLDIDYKKEFESDYKYKPTNKEEAAKWSEGAPDPEPVVANIPSKLLSQVAFVSDDEESPDSTKDVITNFNAIRAEEVLIQILKNAKLYTRYVKKGGTSSTIYVPKMNTGKCCTIIVWNDEPKVTQIDSED